MLRSDVGRWALVALVVAILGIVGVVRTPGPDTSVMGRVAGFGFKLDGSACYLTVAYTVDGRDLHLRTPSEQRWCGYSPRKQRSSRSVPVLVFYDPDDPDDATLTPRGRGPAMTVAAGLAGLAACGLWAGRRNRRQQREEQEPEVSAPSTPASASPRTP